MKMIAFLIVSFLTFSCEKPAICTTGKDHKWDKWKQDGRTTLEGRTNLIRECKACGWQQEKIAERP